MLQLEGFWKELGRDWKWIIRTKLCVLLDNQQDGVGKTLVQDKLYEGISYETNLIAIGDKVGGKFVGMASISTEAVVRGEKRKEIYRGYL